MGLAGSNTMMTALQRRDREHVNILLPTDVNPETYKPPTKHQDDYTLDRHKAIIEIQNWIDDGRWPLSAVEMEQLGEYSAQHYRNSMKAFMEVVEEEDTKNEAESTTTTRDASGELGVSVPDGDVPMETLRDIADVMAKGLLDIEVPEDVEPSSYYRGYLACYIERVHEQDG